MHKFFVKKGLLAAVVLVILGCPTLAFSQTGTAASDRPETTLRPITEADWKSAARDLDYSADQPEKPRNSRDWPGYSNGPSFGLGAFSKVVQGLFILLGVALVAWMVYRFATGPRSKNLRPAELLGISPLDDPDGRLLDSDLAAMLLRAKAEGQWPLAVRLHYLLIIKELNERKLINWRREKTNRDYLNELAPTGRGPAFRAATAVFERVWYGEEPVDAARFDQLEPIFLAVVVVPADNRL